MRSSVVRSLRLWIVVALWTTVAFPQGAPIVGTAPVSVDSSPSAPFVSSTFTATVSVDLTTVTGLSGSGAIPAGLSAFRIPLTFDRTRLQLLSVAPAAGTPFSTAAFSSTSIADANAAGRLSIASSLVGGLAPTGRVPVVALTFRASASGAATIAGDAATISLASAVQASGATVFGPAAIPSTPAGGGVTVQTPPALHLSMTAGPSPAVSGGQIVYTLHAENVGGSAAHSATITATVPAGTSLISANGPATVSGSTVVWNIGDLDAGAAYDAMYGVTVTATAGTTVSASPGTAASSDTATVLSNALAISIASGTNVKPGMIVTATSYGYGAGVLYDVTSGSPVQFAQVPGGWVGALLFTSSGRLIAGTDANGGSLYDATPGGNLLGAAPLASGLGTYITGIAADTAGNLYVSALFANTQIKKISPAGAVTSIGPVLQYPGNVLVNGNTLYVSEGGTGSVKAIDLTTFAVTTLATGFPHGSDHFSGQLVRNSQGRLFVLWGGGWSALYDITTVGTVNSTTPATAKVTFHIDVNELAIDSHDAIYFAGDGSSTVWRSTPVSGVYGAVTAFANGNVSEAEAVAIYPLPTLPLLVLSSAASLNPAVSGQSLTYTVNYENRGGAAASNVTLAANLPAGTTYSSASNSGTFDGTKVNWSIGTVGVGATGSRTFTVNVTANAGARLDPATVTMSAASLTPVIGNLPQLAVVSPPDLRISVASSAASTPLNSYLIYTISYTNNAGAASPNTLIKQTIPANTTFVSADQGGALSSGVVSWNVGSVAVGQSGSVTLVVRAGGTAGTVITNNNCTISGDLAAVVTAQAVSTTVTAASTLSGALVAAPNPVVPGTQVNVAITYQNNAATALNNVTITAPLPPSATFLSATTGGSVVNGNVVWTIPQVAAGASDRVRYSIRTNAAANTTFLATAILSSPANAPGGVAPTSVSVKPYPSSLLLPGTIFSCPSYSDSNIGRISAIQNGVKTFFAQRGGTWAAPLLVGPNGHLYASIDAGVFDATAGGDLSSATPIASSVQIYGQAMAFDDAGNIYRTIGAGYETQVEKITPEGDLSYFGPTFRSMGGMTISGNTMWVSDGLAGTVSVVDLTTGQLTSVLVSGFPTSTDHFSGQLMRTRQGRLYLLWGSNGGSARGLYDITDGGTFSTLHPITAAGAFTVDVNQSGIAPNDDIYFAGDATGNVYRAPFVNGSYGTTVSFIGSMGDNEALAIFPAYKLTIGATPSVTHLNRGDALTFTFAVQNNSISQVGDIAIDAPLPAGLTFTSATNGGVNQSTSVHWSVGTVAAGASATVSMTGTVTAPDGGSLTLTNYTVTGDGRASAAGPDVVVTVNKPVNIQASVSPEPVVVGNLLTYTLRYENLSDAATTNTVVSDTVPAGATFVSASDGGTLAGGVVTWSVGTIASGGSGLLTLTVRADAMPAIVNATYGIITTELGARTGTAVTSTVLPLPAQIAVTASGPVQVTAGSNITYTFTYSNGGGSSATAVVLRDTLPAGTTFVGASGGTLIGSDVVWQLGSIASGAQGAVSLTVATAAGNTGSVTNSAYSLASGAQTAGGPAVVTALVAPPPPAPLVVTLSAVPSPVATNGLLTYTITVSNPANVATDNVIVTNTFPNGTTFVSATGPATTSASGVQWSFGSLAPGDSIAVGLTVSVTAGGGTTLTNSGAVASATGRTPVASGQVQTQVTSPNATLSLATTAPVSVLTGGSITYTLRWTNAGPSTAGAATITAPLPAGTTLVSLSDNGTFANGVATWSLGTLAPATDGYVTMTVAVTAPSGSTISMSGAAIAAQPAIGAAADTFLTSVIAPLPVFTGTLALNASLYIVPDVVHEVASFTYVSGGTGIVSGITETLSTQTENGTVVATQSQNVDSLAAGASVPIAFDWPTTSSPTANYTASFTVTAGDGTVLVQTVVPFSVAAPDGAGLSGSIAATNTPVASGTDLIAALEVVNGGKANYSPLPLEIDVVDPATLAVLRRVAASHSVAAGVTEDFNVNVPTSGLALGDYLLWLTTTAGGGQLLAQTTATVIAPAFTFSPPQSTVVAGSVTTLTATLASPAPSAIDISLSSSDPSLATVPSKVTIASGASSATFPVTGVAPGGPVAIQGTIGGVTNASATVRVVMTGTIAATPQVYEGENEQFDVTIANPGQTVITNGSFAVVIKNAQTNSIVDTIAFTASIAAGASYTHSFTYSTASLAVQNFEADLVWNGITPAETLATAPFKILQTALLRATATVGTTPRVLIWSNCSPGNSGSPCTPVAPPFLTASLTAAGIPYVVVGDEATFLARMRTGTFSGAIIDQPSPAEPKIASEYLGDIEAGFGLLFIDSAPNAMPKLAPALATSFGGTLHGPLTLSLAATPFTHAGTLTLNGNGVKISLESTAQSAAMISGTADAAITYNTYGHGNVVVIPFDLELTHTSAVADLIVAATRFISRVPTVPLDAGTVVPLHITVTTPGGSSVSASVTVTLPAGVTVVDASPALTSSTPATWQATIAPSTTATFDLWVRAASSISPYSATVTAALTGGPPVVTIAVPIDVSADGGTISANLQGDLAALKQASTTSQDVKAITDAIAQLNAIASSNDAVANTGRATQILLDLHAMSIDTTAARGDAARLLIEWQSKVGA